VNPLTLHLLEVLRDLDEAQVLEFVYGLERGNEAPLDAAVFAWRDGGAPDTPVRAKRSRLDSTRKTDSFFAMKRTSAIDRAGNAQVMAEPASEEVDVDAVARSIADLNPNKIRFSPFGGPHAVTTDAMLAHIRVCAACLEATTQDRLNPGPKTDIPLSGLCPDGVRAWRAYFVTLRALMGGQKV
jgi:hypothetical protein